jgi:hypothetical protein
MPNIDGSIDDNLRSFYGPQDDYRVIEEGDVDQGNPGKNYDTPLKFTSKVRGVLAHFGVVYAGKKNGAVDCNNEASDLDLTARLWDIDGSKYGFTNKGGCSRNKFRGEVKGHGKECDFDQDNGSDQSHKPCVGTRLALWRKDRTAIRVRYLYFKPIFEEGTGPYRFVFPWPWIPLPRSWVAKIFLQCRRWYIQLYDLTHSKVDSPPTTQ